MPKKISDEALINALILNGSVSKAADACGLSANAVYKRLQNDRFKNRYEAMQDAVLNTAAVVMANVLCEAVGTLVDVLHDENVSAGVRVSAADALLRHSAKYIEISNIVRRIEALEQMNNMED